MRKLTLLLITLGFLVKANAQQANVTSNWGKEFWVAYPNHQQMNDGTNTQEFTLYLGVGDLPAGVSYATVTVTVDSSGANQTLYWSRTYHIPANTSIDIANTNAFSTSNASVGANGTIPKGSPSAYDFRMLGGTNASLGNVKIGTYSGKGIHIESDYDIAAYGHIYTVTNSGAAMLLPTNTWGTKYVTLNSNQNNANLAYSFFYIIAQKDSTPIQIIPSQQALYGSYTPLTPFTILLSKGQVYQFLGYTNNTTQVGVQLTGSSIESLDTSKHIAVFAGSSRTAGETGGGCTTSSRDNDFQQCYPSQVWGTEFLSSPFATANGSTLNPSVKSSCIYKIVAKENGTLVRINNGANISVPLGSFVSYASSSPCSFVSNKPVTVAQYMTSGNCNTGDGDPELIYLSAKDRGITKAIFYRNNQTVINSNFVNIIVPNDGLSSLRIDGLQYPNLGSNVSVYAHPFDVNYSVVVKGLAAQATQATVTCDKQFFGITYGMGAAESYGYNLGSNFYVGTPNINPNATTKIVGMIYCDANNNGHFDSTGDYAQANLQVSVYDSSNTFVQSVSTNSYGLYELNLSGINLAGSYTIHLNIGGIKDTILTINLTNTIDTTIYANFNYCNPPSAHDSLQINVIPLNPNPVVGAAYPYWVEYRNVGTSTINGIVNLTYNNYLLTYDSCNVSNVTPTANGLAVSANNFNPGDVRGFIGYFTINNNAVAGDTLWTVYSISGNGIIVKDSFYTIINIDSNTVVQSATRAMSPTQIANGKAIEYTIQFKNIYTHNIKNAKIVSVLNNKLRAGTVRVLCSSHNCKVSVVGNKILFEMMGCNLADASSKLKKYGFVKFSVQPQSNLVIGDVVVNNSTVYLDYYNAAPSNNSVTIINASGTLPVKFNSYTATLQKENNVLNTWKVGVEENVKQYNVQRSFNGKDFETVGLVKAIKSQVYNFTDKPSISSTTKIIYYRIEVVDNDGIKSYSFIQAITIHNTKNGISVYPNPSNGNITVQGFDIKHVNVFDMMGKELMRKANTNTVNTLQKIEVNGLQKGVYVVCITQTDNTKVFEKLIVE